SAPIANGTSRKKRTLYLRQRLLEVGLQVDEVLDAQGKPHVVRTDPGRALLLGRQLAVRGAGGMNRQGLRIADVGQVAEQLQTLDQLAARLVAALQTEAQQAPEA